YLAAKVSFHDFYRFPPVRIPQSRGGITCYRIIGRFPGRTSFERVDNRPKELKGQVAAVTANREICTIATSNSKGPIVLGLRLKEQIARAVLKRLVPTLVQCYPKVMSRTHQIDINKVR